MLTIEQQDIAIRIPVWGIQGGAPSQLQEGGLECEGCS